MWRTYSKKDLLSVLAVLEDELQSIPERISEFPADQYASQEEKVQWEIKDLQAEISAVQALVRGCEITKWAKVVTRDELQAELTPAIFLYPALANLAAIKKLLLVFNRVNLVLPYIKTEELEPDLMQGKRAVAASQWAPQNDQDHADLLNLLRSGMVRLVEPHPEITDLFNLFRKLYDRSIGKKVREMDIIERAEFVNSTAYELEIRLLECLAMATFFGSMAISSDVNSYLRTLDIQKNAWTGIKPKSVGMQLRDATDYVDIYARLGVLSNINSLERMKLNELRAFRNHPSRKEFVDHLGMYSYGISTARSERALNDNCYGLTQEISHARNRFLKANMKQEFIKTSPGDFLLGELLGATENSFAELPNLVSAKEGDSVYRTILILLDENKRAKVLSSVNCLV